MINKLKKNHFFKILLKYSLCFGIIALFICYIFIKNHMSFIWTNYDGLNQHFITLNYFKDILNNLIKYQEFNTLTWNIGFGLDMFSNLAYYVIGDLFSYISIFVPSKYLAYLYSVLVPLRLYFAGISFLYYCKHRNKVNTSAIIGALMYTFCSFGMFSAVRHPYFINAMIIFPISMIGIERYINENKKVLYIFSVFLMFFSSFYFGYMNALVIAIYGIILWLKKYKGQYKKNIKILIMALIYAIIGIMMCSFILLPAIYQFFNSSRTNITADISYTINYYRTLLSSITTSWTGNNWSFVSCSAVALFTIPIFIRNYKKNLELFILMVVLCLPLVFSSCSYIISGLSFPSNRYVYMLMFVISFATVLVLDNKIVVDIKKYLIMLVIYLSLLVVFETGINTSLLAALIVLFLIILIYLYKDKFVFKSKSYVLEVVNIVSILSIILNSYFLYNVNYNNYVSEFIEFYNLEYTYNTVNGDIPNFYKALNYIKKEDKGFYNIAKSSDDLWNLGLIKNYNSINYFYSINSNLYKELSNDLNNSQGSTNFEIKEFDNRTKIASLLGVKYFISNIEKTNKYEYEMIKKYDNTYIYRNKYPTSFAKIYTKCINTKTYDKLSPLEKEDALLKYYITDDCNNSNINLSSINKIRYESNIKFDNNIVLTNETGNKIKLHLKDKVNGELYLRINNINYKEPSIKQIAESQYIREVDKNRYLALNKWHVEDEGFIITARTTTNENSEQIFGDNYTYYSGNNDILINLGYYKDYSDDLEIELSKLGIYNFDSIELYSVSMDGYSNDIKELNKTNFKISNYGDSYVEGTVSLEKDGVISFSTLYNKGWNIKVDGKEVDTFKNKYFLATNIEKGNHKIELRYKTLYVKEGIILSILGVCCYIIIFTKDILIKKND